MVLGSVGDVLAGLGVRICRAAKNFTLEKSHSNTFHDTCPQELLQQEEKFLRTNLMNKGLISADRNNKATLLLTIPSSVFKSSAKDLSSPISYLRFRGDWQHTFVHQKPSLL